MNVWRAETAQGVGCSQEHSRYEVIALGRPITCQDAISKRPFSHRGHKGTSQEDIRLRPIFPSSAGIYQPD